MKRQIPTGAVVATFVAARKPDTNPERVQPGSQRSSGHSDGSITVRPAVNMDGAEVDMWLHDGAINSQALRLSRIWLE